ncbi:MAG: PEGA domain-containing protein [Acetivibrio ethanolgignens]
MSTKGKGFWFLGGMVIIIIFAAAIAIANTTKKSSKPAAPIESQPAKEEIKDGYDTKILGIVKEIDEIEGTITIYDTDADIDRTLTYTGGTRVVDRYDKERLISWLMIGELVNAYYYQASYKLTKVEINKEAWEYGGINRFQFDMTNQRVTIAQKLYYYEKDLFVTGAGEELGLIDINARDELMMKGIGNQVYSVIITKGHGYIRLANYDAFLGGTIEVGYGIIMPVTKDMLIAAREGTYKVKMENGELTGTKEVTIKRNEEYTLDMSEFHVDEERVGKAVFMIDPEGAKLYINGIETDYSKKVRLNYGDYEIRVEMEGYTTFQGILTIEEKTPVICVSLSIDGADTSGTTDGVTITPSDTDSSPDSTEGDSSDIEEASESTESSANSFGTTLVDEDHVITISAPVGAKLYWNGAYKGVVPVTFAKEIGNHVITFSQTGCLTRSYSCEITDDGSDVTLNFPDMVKKESN